MSSCSRVSTVPAGIAGVTRPTSSNPNTTPKTTSPNRWRKATAPFASAVPRAVDRGFRNDPPSGPAAPRRAHRSVPLAQVQATAQGPHPRMAMRRRRRAMSGASVVSLHGFQCEAIDQIECEIACGVRRVLYVAPTGSGKTVVAAEITRRAASRCQRVLFLAHRREIIDQTSRKLAANGIPLGLHGIVLAGRERDLRPQAMVQVASIATLRARGVRSDTMRLPPADIIIFDESHRIRGRTREYLVSLYPDAVLLGLTATPCRGDGRGLGNIFETMIQAPQVSELIGLGFLVGARVFAPVDKDIAKGVRIEKGDYVVSALAERMNTTELVGDVVRDWLQHGERRRTVAFAVNVAHSVHIRDEFVRAGVRAEHLDGSTRLAEREAILARLGSGKTEVVSNCMVLTEGWDMPEVGCCILARPTKKMGLFRQMIGRALRPAPGKTNAIILDHSGAVFRHGLPEDRVDWTLDPDKTARSPDHEARTPEMFGGPTLLDCGQCGALREGGKACPHCGF